MVRGDRKNRRSLSRIMFIILPDATQDGLYIVGGLNIFNCLKHHDRSFIVFDHNKFHVKWGICDQEKFPCTRANIIKNLCLDAQEDIPLNSPEPRV